MVAVSRKDTMVPVFNSNDVPNVNKEHNDPCAVKSQSASESEKESPYQSSV